MGNLKALLVLSAAFAVSVQGAGDTADKILAAFNKCREANPITEDEVNLVKNHELPTSQIAKCLMACMLKEGKMMKDGKYLKDNAFMMVDALNKNDPETADKMKQIIDICTKEVPEGQADECELAFQITKCSAFNAKKMSVKPPTFSL